MSFSGELKDELSRQLPKARHCNLAEIAAVLQFSGTVSLGSGNESVEIETENVVLAKKYLQQIKKTFHFQMELSITKAQSGGKGHKYRIQTANAEDALRLIKDTLTDGRHEEFVKQMLGKPCCRRAYIRGAFLSTGSMSNPGKSYHFEVVCRSEDQAGLLKDLIDGFGLEAKIVLRKNRYIVYLKDSTAIVDILNVMGANNSLMELENVRIIKDMRNSANRQYNCDSANINKMVKAASRQMEDIYFIDQHLGIDHLPPPLRDMAYTRMENPDISLQELGTCLSPPVGKSGVNHRLRKLAEIAQSLRDNMNEVKE